MSERVVCDINGVDYGFGGNQTLIAIQNLTATGGGKIGSATLLLKKVGGGGYDIRNGHEVRLYIYDDSINRIVFEYIAGFITRRRQGRLPGTNIKVWVLDVQGWDSILDCLVAKSVAIQGVLTTNAPLDTQVQQVFNQLNAPPATGIDAVSRVVDPLSGYNLPGKRYIGVSARMILRDICNEATVVDPDLRLDFWIAPDQLIRPTFGPPMVYLANRPVGVIINWHFTDIPGTPVGAHPILINPEYERVLESPKIVQTRQSTRPGAPTVQTYTDAASVAAYPFPYTPDGSIWGLPIEDRTAIDSASQLANLRRNVLSNSRPRETINIAVLDRVRPGDVAAVTIGLESLADEPKRVIGVGVDFKNWKNPVHILQLGQRPLELGETGDDDLLPMPTEGDPVNPEPPTGFGYTTVFDDIGNHADVNITFTASTSPDRAGYIIELLVGAGEPAVYNVPTTAGGVIHWSTTMPGSSAFTVDIYTYDFDDRRSGPLHGSGTSAAVPDPAPPTAIGFDTTLFGGLGYTWNSAGGVMAVKWTHPTPAITGGQYHIVVTRIGSSAPAENYYVPTTQAGIIIYSRLRNQAYRVDVFSITAGGHHGSSSNFANLTVPAAAPAFPTGFGLGSKGIGGDNLAWFKFGWTIPPPSTGTGTPGYFEIGLFDGSDVRNPFHRIDLTQGSEILKGLSVSRSYVAKIRTVEQFGDPGLWSIGVDCRVDQIKDPPPGPWIDNTEPDAPFSHFETDPTSTGTLVRATSGTLASSAVMNHVVTGTQVVKVWSGYWSVEPSTPLAVKLAVVRQSGTGGSVVVKVYWYDASLSGVGTPTSITVPTLSGSFQWIKELITAHSSARAYRLYIETTGTGSAVTTGFHVDGVRHPTQPIDLYLATGQFDNLYIFDETGQQVGAINAWSGGAWNFALTSMNVTGKDGFRISDQHGVNIQGATGNLEIQTTTAYRVDMSTGRLRLIGDSTDKGIIDNTQGLLTFLMSGAVYGGTRLILSNDSGANGVLLILEPDDPAIQLIDLIIGHPGGVKNIRLEGRSAYCFLGTAQEFQFGDPGNPHSVMSSGGFLQRMNGIRSAGTVRADGGYLASDGSAGTTITIPLAKITLGGADGSMTVKDGIIIAATNPT